MTWIWFESPKGKAHLADPRNNGRAICAARIYMDGWSKMDTEPRDSKICTGCNRRKRRLKEWLESREGLRA